MVKLINFYIKNKTLNIDKKDVQKQEKETLNRGNDSKLDLDDLVI
jgi:hypothetical protein